MINKLLNRCKYNTIDLLYHLYKTDRHFPKSCGSVSMALALMLYNADDNSEYDISYIRGHFINENEDEHCYCIEIEEDFNRFSDLSEFKCVNCGCDYIVEHSWVEVKNKKTDENVILDFTSIQFIEAFTDCYYEILESNFNKSQLYNYLERLSKFIISANDSEYEKYIKSKKKLDGKHIYDKTVETISENSVSDLTVLLEAINYKL